MQAPQIFPKSYPDTVADAAAGSTIFVDDPPWHGDAFIVTKTTEPRTDGRDDHLVVRLRDGLAVLLPPQLPARIVALGADTLDENW